MQKTHSGSVSSDYALDANGSFVIKNYLSKKPFSNFLPGIAGLFGTPMWVFYVNRGQGIASFGTRNKDNAILEFFPANKAYQMVSTVGFRTFYKIKQQGASADKFFFYEPFKTTGALNTHAHHTMEISSHEFSVVDRNPSAGLETKVTYFTVPGEPLAALVRQVVVTNTTTHPVDIEMLDGLPQVMPYGMNEFFAKQMSRTIEAWMVVENLSKKAPFYKLKVDATDRPEVTMIEGGNFYFGIEEEGRRLEMMEPYVDPSVLFGACLDFIQPDAFFQKASFKPAFKQITENKTPCAFGCTSFKLAPGKSKTIYGVSGHARSLDELNRFLARVKKDGYFSDKRSENHKLIKAIQSPIFSITQSPVFDQYGAQTYLDNALRGGIPVCLGDKTNPLVYYAYARKHGDLERDYNRFLVEDAYFAQGDGNYRDVNQNRRSDVWFEPRVREANIRTFMNCLQLDGFNPLVVKGTDYHFKKNKDSQKVLNQHFGAKNAQDVLTFVSDAFKLGELYRFLEAKGWITEHAFNKFLSDAAAYLTPEQRAEHGEGFWVDHWTYNLDLIESYLAIFPEKITDLLLGSREYTFYDNAHRVRPRSDKYFLLERRGVRQYQSVLNDKEKAKFIAGREKDVNTVRTQNGKGDIYKTTLFAKLVSLYVNKLASLDAHGVGVEMEADKPSWYDALNGLPGLAGSSLPETFELKRLAIFLIGCLDESGIDLNDQLLLHTELHEFVDKMSGLLKRYFHGAGKSRDMDFWQEASKAKEKYRESTIWGVSGSEKKISFADLRIFLEHGREKTQIGIQKAFDSKTGLYPTYFANEVVKHRVLSKDDEGTRVDPLEFKQKSLPLFLESHVHALKVEKDPEARKALYRAVKKSPLYDTKLGMYKVNAPMQEASLEVGRGRVFTPGWLENESIWLHMEYKYLLEALKSGLAEEFFEDFKKAFVPFQPAERYGRSILENSSFVVSSAFPDEKIHGTGFVARLSGSTAEFLQMWHLMNVGKKPFFLGPDKKVSLRFEPKLPFFLFTHHETKRTWINGDGEEIPVTIPKNSTAFVFLGKTLVTYYNPKRLDTFGKTRVAVKKVKLTDRSGRVTEFRGDTIPSPFSLRVRDEWIPKIELELG